jgi:hypothetical protein
MHYAWPAKHDILITMNTGVTTLRPRIGHLLVVFGLFLSLLTLTFQATNPGSTKAFGTSEVAQLSNQYRHNADLPALILSEALTNSAQSKADDMAAKGYFAHNSPDGTTPWDFFAKVKFTYDTAGENLALTNQSATSVVDGWYNSPGHRANMLSSQFTEVGYGIAFVPTFTYNGTTYSDVYLVAAHYAKPTESGAKAQFTVKPQTPAVPPTTPIRQTSGNGVTTVSETHASLLSKLPYYGLGAGMLLVLVGAMIEIRRLLKHLPLIPHLR